MVELAELIDDETNQTLENLESELQTIQNSIVAILLENTKSKEVEVVNEDGSTSKEDRTVLKSKTQIDSDLRKLETDLAEEFHENTLTAIKTILTITTSYIVSELNLKTQHKLDANKVFDGRVLVGDRTLSQRTAIAVSNLFNEVQKVYRRGLIAGTDVGVLAKEIESVFDKNIYQFKNIVRSELFMAYRIQFGESVDKNGVKWIKFHESFPRHPNRKRHKCYELANMNKYGKGKGIFKPTDSIIYFPHPQCTGWLEIIE